MTRRENLLRTIRREGPQWVPYRYDGSLTMLWPPLSARPREGGTDDWGVRWLATGTDEGSYPDDTPVVALHEAPACRVPDTDFDAVTAALRCGLAALRDEDTLVIVRNEMALFERAKHLLGTAEFLMACAAQPKAVHAIFDTIADYQVEVAKAMMAAGVAGVRFTDDWGMQNALFIHPAQWREYIKPRLRRMYAAVKEAGGLVFQHSCGHLEEIVSDLIELGVDVLDPCQPRSNDIFAWKRRYGADLCFMGGLDTQGYLSFGTPEEIREQVLKVLAVMSEGGGYIAAPSHTISLPEASSTAMLRAIDELNGRTDA